MFPYNVFMASSLSLLIASSLALSQPDEKEENALFKPRTRESLTITFKQVTKENAHWNAVHQIYEQAGLSDKIVSVEQPALSPEINSQNFIIQQASGQKLVLRRCVAFPQKEHYASLHKYFETLKNNGVHAPEFYPIKGHPIPYFELEEGDKKVGWVFFKHIDAKHYFSGTPEELEKAAEQIGKMHAQLKKGTLPATSKSRPFLPLSEWTAYLQKIKEKNALDEYDQMILQNQALIEELIQFVEANLQEEPVQPIHFDLNSLNFLVDDKGEITIMDFDNVMLDTVYTDIGFAFQRLLTTCIETGEKDIKTLIEIFLRGYKKGNPDLKIDLKKLTLAAYNRALRNIATNLDLKYNKNSKEWLTSLPINIQRLKQLQLLTSKI